MRSIVFVASLLLAFHAAAADVRIQADDGTTLFARESGKGARGVLLIHDAGRTSADWGLIQSRLEGKGFRVLALDLRGHGESASLLEATEPDWSAMTTDVRAGVARLRKQGAKSVSVVGAGLGANLALAAAAEDPQLASLVLLSPGLNIKGHRPSQSVQNIGEKPILMAAAKGDGMSSNALKYLNNQVSGKKRLVYLGGTGSGAALLDDNPGLEDQIYAWLDGHFDVDDSSLQDPKVRAGDTDSMESKGKRFGDAE
jgi:pimeloyl-ACP methyl ester carboxylesterase